MFDVAGFNPKEYDGLTLIELHEEFDALSDALVNSAELEAKGALHGHPHDLMLQTLSTMNTQKIRERLAYVKRRAIWKGGDFSNLK